MKNLVFISVALMAHCMLAFSFSVPIDLENEIPDEDTRQSVVRSLSGAQHGPSLTPDEFLTGRHIAMDSPQFTDGKDPLEGELFEGDIIIDEDLTGKNGIISQRQMWPNGIIPYTIAPSFSGNDRSIIANAMDVYHQKTCIKFVPKNSAHRNWVDIVVGSGCSSHVGMTGRGAQRVSLGRGCVHTGIVQHELMHASGFWHEQSRHDRDSYVTIHWNNIQSGLQNNFNKVTADRSQTFGQPYDYGSVMHYGRTAFAINRGQPTITAVKSGVTLGQRNGLSRIDIAKLNGMYKCGGVTGTTKRPTTMPPVIPKKCVDISSSCTGWAAKSECDKNASWMKKHCPVACKTCETMKKCKDNNSECSKWSANGFCKHDSFSGFMTDTCPKSCKVCGDCM